MSIETHVELAVGCESGACHHDLARGVTLAELWGGDGPHAVRPLNPPGARVVDRFADDEPAAAVQRWAV